MESVYNLSIWNIGKKLPKNYDALIIPEIEREVKRIMGDMIKYKIYNDIVYYYNEGKKNGILETISIFSEGKEKKVYYKIGKNSIKIKIK